MPLPPTVTPWLASCRDLGEELMGACSCELCLCVTSHPRLCYLKSCSKKKTAEILKLITSYISHIRREDDEGFRMKGGKTHLKCVTTGSHIIT